MRGPSIGRRTTKRTGRQFAADAFSLTTHELAGNYGIAESTGRDWCLFWKRNPDLEVG